MVMLYFLVCAYVSFGCFWFFFVTHLLLIAIRSKAALVSASIFVLYAIIFSKKNLSPQKWFLKKKFGTSQWSKEGRLLERQFVQKWTNNGGKRAEEEEDGAQKKKKGVQDYWTGCVLSGIENMIRTFHFFCLVKIVE